MSDPMTGIRAVRAALDEVEARAAELRLELGREIRKARAADAPQKDIAAELRLTREQVRRIQEAADIADGLKPARAAD
ncbi:hypothetical protein ACIBQ6_21880 [Nonomuraea sp. NPDC049655]|uniref:hypothetical protein n=1 Tax=Nonomuraea sp. NPDC049655 TaxID=3364355 RepID=UPI0037B909CF